MASTVTCGACIGFMIVDEEEYFGPAADEALVLANEVAISFLNSDPNSYHGDRPSHQIFCCPLGCPKYFSGEGPLQQHLATTDKPGHPGPAALALWGIDTGSGSGAMLVARDVEINLT